MRLAPVICWATRGVAGLLLAALVAAGPASGGGGDNPVFAPGSEPYDLTYGEWSARHWQWEYSLPVDAHPLYDTADVSAGQSGPVWFLGGTFASSEITPGVFVGEVTRKVEIPAGKALFFPLVDVEASTIEGNGSTEADLRAAAEFFADFIVPDTLFCEIDGHDVRHLTRYRVQSPLFTFGPLPDNNILEATGYDAPEGATSPAVSDGVFVMVKPLAVGKHTIHFGGKIDVSEVGGPVFVQDITYEIHVKKK